MDFSRLTLFASFIEAIPASQFDITIIVGCKARCAIGWAPEFDARAEVTDGVTVKWAPTNEFGYRAVAVNLFGITDQQARELFHSDAKINDLLPWVKNRFTTRMGPVEMANRIRDFVEYYQQHPEPVTTLEPITPTENTLEIHQVTSDDPEEVDDEDELPPAPVEDHRTPLQILGL